MFWIPAPHFQKASGGLWGWGHRRKGMWLWNLFSLITCLLSGTLTTGTTARVEGVSNGSKYLKMLWRHTWPQGLSYDGWKHMKAETKHWALGKILWPDNDVKDLLWSMKAKKIALEMFSVKLCLHFLWDLGSDSGEHRRRADDSLGQPRLKELSFVRKD